MRQLPLANLIFWLKLFREKLACFYFKHLHENNFDT